MDRKCPIFPKLCGVHTHYAPSHTRSPPPQYGFTKQGTIQSIRIFLTAQEPEATEMGTDSSEDRSPQADCAHRRVSRTHPETHPPHKGNDLPRPTWCCIFGLLSIWPEFRRGRTFTPETQVDLIFAHCLTVCMGGQRGGYGGRLHVHTVSRQCTLPKIAPPCFFVRFSLHLVCLYVCVVSVRCCSFFAFLRVNKVCFGE